MGIDTGSWKKVQDAIWACEVFHGHSRVACTIRQQTDPPARGIKLLLVGIAPPFEPGVALKTRARSATNHPDDNLRKLFVLATLPGTWEDLLERGLFLIHSVKCAITV